MAESPSRRNLNGSNPNGVKPRHAPTTTSPPTGDPFVSDEAATAIDAARDTYIAAKQDIYRQATERSNEITKQRCAIARNVYYEELARERSFGTATFIPSNTAKMTKTDRAMFSATTALYPDEMVERANALGPMLARPGRTTPPAPDNAAGAPQPKCSTSTTPCSTAASGSPTTSTHPKR